MESNSVVKSIKQKIEELMDITKCRNCGCMRGALETVKGQLSQSTGTYPSELLLIVENSLERLEPMEYTWKGCKPCWSAEITNAFDDAFPDLNNIHFIENNLVNTSELGVLPAIGEYHVLSLEQNSPVAISTLGSTELADKISELKPTGISIVGKTETENIGVEKIIKNVLAVPSIKYLVLCGNDSEGHYSGDALLSLAQNGVNEKMRIVNSKGKKPVLSNTTVEEVNAFRSQIEVINMIGIEDLNKILDRTKQLAEKANYGSNYGSSTLNGKPIMSTIETIIPKEKAPNTVKLDKAGYFVIVPKADRNLILVEHYNYDNQLLRIIKGDKSRDIYWAIVENKWVTELSHAAYLGKELAKAEMSMKYGFKYIQDKA